MDGARDADAGIPLLADIEAGAFVVERSIHGLVHLEAFFGFEQAVGGLLVRHIAQFAAEVEEAQFPTLVE